MATGFASRAERNERLVDTGCPRVKRSLSRPERQTAEMSPRLRIAWT